VQAGFAQTGLQCQVADEINRDAPGIGQQYHIAHAGHLHHRRDVVALLITQGER
jgi:hypothetical protein